jgi:YidC/Oxa1 family membrane protein insertase
MGILLLNVVVMSKLYPQPGKRQNAAQREGQKQPGEAAPDEPLEPGQPDREAGPSEPTDTLPSDDRPAQPAPAEEGHPEPDELQAVVPPRYATLGSLDTHSPYRMLVTLTNRGAAVQRIELNSPRYGDLEDRSGYLGHLIVEEPFGEAQCRVQVVGPGTPADQAGIKAGDVILAAAGRPVNDLESLRGALAETKPKQTVPLKIRRDGVDQEVSVTLGRRPLDVVQPEGGDPLSFLLTLARVDDDQLPEERKDEKEDEDKKKEKKKDRYADVPRDESIRRELTGVDPRGGKWQLDLRSGNWVVLGPDDDPRQPEDWNVEDGQPTAEEGGSGNRVRFGRWLKRWDLTVVKTFELARVPSESTGNADYPGYHLLFDVEVFNVGEKARSVAYQLDGPTGLPAEGKWYSRKVGSSMGLYGLRDVAVSFEGKAPSVIPCLKVADGTVGPPWQDVDPLKFIGVDAQYFAAILIPQKEAPSNVWFAESRPLRVGAVDGKLKLATNTSCRVRSKVHKLEPNDALTHRYLVFAGPKRPPLLEQQAYGLKELVYYGWFWWVAIPMSHILHLFYAILGNYGLAIILLTVLVRGGMFPLSRKQALGQRKMQELQPELRKITEKYKKDMEGRSKAQRELFEKHDYHPLSGCWVMFLQLPIFIGLYRSLMVDVELRQAPLLWEGVRWCSNLAAPDMLFDWSGFWAGLGWDWFNEGQKMLALGPYFNLLPCFTVVLFLAQQAMFMPPAADEQAAMQQKMMKFMMVFIGVMFFKVASGLCLYFIASSLWGVAERKLLPKATSPGGGDQPQPAEAPSEPPAKPPARPPRPRDRERDRQKPEPSPSPMQSLWQKLKDANGPAEQETRDKRKKKKYRGKN